MGNSLQSICGNCFPSVETAPLKGSSPTNYSSSPTEEVPTMGHPYSSEISAAKQVFFEILHCNELPQLQKSPELLIEGTDSPNAFILRTSWSVPCPPRTFLDFFHDKKKRLEWDKNLEDVVEVQCTPEFRLCYNRFKKIFGITQRDMLYISKEFETREGLALVSTSVEHPEYPLNSCVRLNVFAAGYFLKEVEGLTQVTSITKLDFGGSIPNSLIRRVTTISMKSFITSLKRALNKHLLNAG